MSKHLSARQLRGIAQIADMGEMDRLGRAIQAIIERKPFGASSLDGEIVATFEGVDFTEANFRETIVHQGQRMKRHRNGGGWVPAEQSEHGIKSFVTQPFVAETAYVGPWAMVYGNARVTGNARILDYARVFGFARVRGAEVSQYAWVFDSAMVTGNSRVSGNSRVRGSVMVADNGQVGENANLGGRIIVRDEAYVGGDVDLSYQYAFSGSQVITSVDDLRDVYRYITL